MIRALLAASAAGCLLALSAVPSANAAAFAQPEFHTTPMLQTAAHGGGGFGGGHFGGGFGGHAGGGFAHSPGFAHAPGGPAPGHFRGGGISHYAPRYSAHAYHGHPGYRHHQRRFVYGAYPYYAGAYYGGCGYLRQRAVDTGSSYWWHRYEDCIAGY
jgi:hypothetical protein